MLHTLLFVAVPLTAPHPVAAPLRDPDLRALRASVERGPEAADPVDERAPFGASPLAAQKDPEYDKRKKAAGKDPIELWKLYEWCKEQKKEKEAKATLRDIVKVDPLHKEANVALGHLFYDEKWFENQKKIDEYKKAKEIEAKLAQGLVEHKGEWVAKDDLPFLEKGLVRDDEGEWVTAEVAQKKRDGWIKQDLEWIAPDQKENIEKGLWKCGNQWLPLAEADEYHAEIEQPWKIPTKHFVLWTTCDREVATGKVVPQLEAAVEELERVYAVKLDTPLNVMVLRNYDQYNAAVAGDEGRPGIEVHGLANLHYACFADSVLADEADTMGLAYWDSSTDEGNKFGVHAVRHAIGLSFSEHMDPSPAATAQLAKTGNANEAYYKKFYDEKKVPGWFRYGAATYAERYYDDKSVLVGGNRQWTKEWSVKNIVSQGGLRSLKQIFEFKLRFDLGPDGTKLINEAGLMIAFALDGGVAPVQEKLVAAQAAIKAKKDKKTVTDAVKALEAAIIKHEADLRKFAGL